MDHVENETADLIASQLNGRLTRRQLATGVLAIPAISALIAACGSDSKDTTAATGAPSDTGGEAATIVADTTETSAAGSSVAPTAGGNLIVAMDLPGGPFDPVGMYDLVAYGLVAQCFEFLCTLGDNDDIGPGLATEWSSNADASEWTFKLRDGVTWQSGDPFTAADVAATMDRLVAGGNSGLGGIISKGAVTAPDPLTAVFKLDKPVGLFPYLVSVFNAQTVITPVDYPLGNTLDKNPEGTGPWILDNLDPTTSAKFRANPGYWGGAPLLDTIEFQFFPDTDTQVTALQGGNVDVVLQFQASTGNSLFSDSNINVTTLRASTHRQLWMRCDTGQFADKKVRQALALTLDRPALITTLFDGKADLGNDHVIAPIYPYFDSTQPQRTRDIDKAKSLLAEAGFPDGIEATLYAGDLQEIKQLAQLVSVQAADAGFKLTANVVDNGSFYGQYWCPADPADPPCSGAAEIGIVDYGHRATPDVFLNAALKTNGIWNSSQYSSTELDDAFTAFQASPEADDAGRAAAAKNIQTILNEDTAVIIPYFYNYLSASSTKVSGAKTSALGQIFLAKAAKA
jgi:peptide/nickel transport system substrate-binding protein